MGNMLCGKPQQFQEPVVHHQKTISDLFTNSDGASSTSLEDHMVCMNYDVKKITKIQRAFRRWRQWKQQGGDNHQSFYSDEEDQDNIGKVTQQELTQILERVMPMNFQELFLTAVKIKKFGRHRWNQIFAFHSLDQMRQQQLSLRKQAQQSIIKLDQLQFPKNYKMATNDMQTKKKLLLQLETMITAIKAEFHCTQRYEVLKKRYLTVHRIEPYYLYDEFMDFFIDNQFDCEMPKLEGLCDKVGYREIEGSSTYVKECKNTREFNNEMLGNLLFRTFQPEYQFAIDKDRQQIIMEKGISLLHLQNQMNEEKAIDMIYSIARQICQLHYLGYIHGDVKIDNIIYSKRYKMWRLIDFGLISPIQLSNQPGGTQFHYMSTGDVKSDLLNLWLTLSYFIQLYVKPEEVAFGISLIEMCEKPMEEAYNVFCEILLHKEHYNDMAALYDYLAPSQNLEALIQNSPRAKRYVFDSCSRAIAVNTEEQDLE